MSSIQDQSGPAPVHAVAPQLQLLQAHAQPSKSLLMPKKKRTNVTRACQRCRKRRIKCDGRRPSCSSCGKLQQECDYATTDNRQRAQKNGQLSALQGEVAEIRTALYTLQYGSYNEALLALQSLRSSTNKSSGAQEADCPVVDSSGNAPAPKLSEKQLHAIFNDTTSRQSTCKSIVDDAAWKTSATFTASSLPPQDVVRKGTAFFFSVVAGLFYVMTADDFEALFAQVFESQSDPDIIAVAEICAVAAVGAHYHPDGVADDIKDALFRTAIQHVNDFVESSVERAIRALACLAAYGIIEKRRTTPTLIRLGLRLARWSSAPCNYLIIVRKKLYRTMIFLECWLSTSLGYNPDLSKHETEHVIFPVLSIDENTDDSTQSKISQVALHKAQVLKETCGPVLASADTIESQMAKLDDWYQGLPSSMTLRSLLTQDSTPLTGAQQGSLLLAHAMYLGAVILLHRPLLAAMADSNLGMEWSLENVSREQTPVYHSRCVEAARSSARIFILIGFGSESCNMHARCWLSIFEIFTACTVLLYDIAVRFLLHAERGALVQEDLGRVGILLQMLRHSASSDRVATRVHKTLAPVYDVLASLHGDYHSTDLGGLPTVLNGDLAAKVDHSSPVSSAGSMRPGPSTDVRQVTEILAEILKDPFGHGGKQGLKLYWHDSGLESCDWWVSDT